MPGFPAHRVEPLAAVVLSVLSAGCLNNPADHPYQGEYAAEMQLVWEAFDSLYVGFAQRDLDWDEMGEYYLSRAAGAEDHWEAWSLMAEMLGILEDPGVIMYNPSWDTTLVHWEPESFTNVDYDVLMEALEPDGFRWVQEGIWGYAVHGPDSIPVLVVAQWSGLFSVPQYDLFLDTYGDAPAMIIDARLCGAGDIVSARNLARNHLEQTRVVYYQQRRAPGEGHAMAPPEPVDLYYRYGYEGPTAVLIGQGNRGAGDYFAAMMTTIPHVTLMGDTTLGACSGYGYRQLPEGWLYSVPDITLLRLDTTFVEGSGIAPNIYVEATQEDFAAGVDPVLEHALEWAESQ